MARRWSKAQVWVPGGYLVLVVAMLVYIAIGSRTGDIGFFGVWPILATAPVSLLLLSTFGPAADALVNATAIWALLRYVARRCDARSTQL